VSIEELNADLKDVIGRCPSGPLTTAAEMAKFQKDELLPIIQGMLEEMGEMDLALSAVVEHSEDLLHVDSATTFAGIIEGGRKIAEALLARLTPADPELHTLVTDWVKLADEGVALLDEITYPDPEDDDETETEQ